MCVGGDRKRKGRRPLYRSGTEPHTCTCTCTSDQSVRTKGVNDRRKTSRACVNAPDFQHLYFPLYTPPGNLSPTTYMYAVSDYKYIGPGSYRERKRQSH